jgi:hypothetical protein
MEKNELWIGESFDELDYRPAADHRDAAVVSVVLKNHVFIRVRLGEAILGWRWDHQRDSTLVLFQIGIAHSVENAKSEMMFESMYKNYWNFFPRNYRIRICVFGLDFACENKEA